MKRKIPGASLSEAGELLAGPSGRRAMAWSALSEGEKAETLKGPAAAAWAQAREKLRQVELAHVHESKGDVRALGFYKELSSSVHLLESMAAASRAPAPSVSRVSQALQNLERYRRDFSESYRAKDELTMAVYATMVVGLLKATTRAVARGVEYTKRPDGTFASAFEEPRGLSQTTFEDALDRFNSHCASGQMDRYFSRASGKGRLVGVVVGAVGAVAIAFGVVWLVRELIYHYFRARVEIAQELRGLALFLAVNASRIEGSKPTSAASQRKAVEDLREWADKVDVDQKASGEEAARDLRDDDAEVRAAAPLGAGPGPAPAGGDLPVASAGPM